MKHCLWVGESVQQLKVHIALVEDLRTVPSTYNAWSQLPLITASRDAVPFSGHCWHLHSHLHILTQMNISLYI